MLNHGRVRAGERPEAITIDDYSVWVAGNIVSVTVTDEQGDHTEFEYDLIQYGKDEFIHSMIEKNTALDDQLTDAQMALCELYEMLEPIETAEPVEGEE